MSGFSLQKYINDYYAARDNLDIAVTKYSILDGLLVDIEDSEILSNANAINNFNASIVPAFVILKNNLLADSTSAINDYLNKTATHKNAVNFYNYQIAYLNKIITYRNTSLFADRITEYNTVNAQIGSQIVLINSQNANLSNKLGYLTSVYNSKTTINTNIQNLMSLLNQFYGVYNDVLTCQYNSIESLNQTSGYLTNIAETLSAINIKLIENDAIESTLNTDLNTIDSLISSTEISLGTLIANITSIENQLDAFSTDDVNSAIDKAYANINELSNALIKQISLISQQTTEYLQLNDKYASAIENYNLLSDSSDEITQNSVNILNTLLDEQVILDTLTVLIDLEQLQTNYNAYLLLYSQIKNAISILSDNIQTATDLYTPVQTLIDLKTANISPLDENSIISIDSILNITNSSLDLAMYVQTFGKYSQISYSINYVQNNQLNQTEVMIINPSDVDVNGNVNIHLSGLKENLATEVWISYYSAADKNITQYDTGHMHCSTSASITENGLIETQKYGTDGAYSLNDVIQTLSNAAINNDIISAFNDSGSLATKDISIAQAFVIDNYSMADNLIVEHPNSGVIANGSNIYFMDALHRYYQVHITTVIEGIGINNPAYRRYICTGLSIPFEPEVYIAVRLTKLISSIGINLESGNTQFRVLDILSDSENLVTVSNTLINHNDLYKKYILCSTSIKSEYLPVKINLMPRTSNNPAVTALTYNLNNHIVKTNNGLIFPNLANTATIYSSINGKNIKSKVLSSVCNLHNSYVDNDVVVLNNLGGSLFYSYDGINFNQSALTGSINSNVGVHKIFNSYIAFDSIATDTIYTTYDFTSIDAITLPLSLLIKSKIIEYHGAMVVHTDNALYFSYNFGITWNSVSLNSHDSRLDLIVFNDLIYVIPYGSTSSIYSTNLISVNTINLASVTAIHDYKQYLGSLYILSDNDLHLISASNIESTLALTQTYTKLKIVNDMLFGMDLSKYFYVDLLNIVRELLLPSAASNIYDVEYINELYCFAANSKYYYSENLIDYYLGYISSDETFEYWYVFKDTFVGDENAIMPISYNLNINNKSLRYKLENIIESSKYVGYNDTISSITRTGSLVEVTYILNNISSNNYYLDLSNIAASDVISNILTTTNISSIDESIIPGTSVVVSGDGTSFITNTTDISGLTQIQNVLSYTTANEFAIVSLIGQMLTVSNPINGLLAIGNKILLEVNGTISLFNILSVSSVLDGGVFKYSLTLSENISTTPTWCAIYNMLLKFYVGNPYYKINSSFVYQGNDLEFFNSVINIKNNTDIISLTYNLYSR